MNVECDEYIYYTSPAANLNMDTIYPEPMSRLHRRVVPKKRRGQANRYRTQPVTFSEIQEVDEDNIDDSSESTVATSSRSEQDLNRKFEEFIKSREKMMDQVEKTSSIDENSNTTKSSPSPPPPGAQNNRFTSRPSI